MGRNMFNGDLLYAAFEKAAKDDMAKKIHEWIIYTAPPEILKIYHNYQEMCEEELENEIKVDM
jgi:hypothetical protein